MPFRLQCPDCRATLAFPESVAGKSIRCPGCRKVFQVAAPKGKPSEGPPRSPSAVRAGEEAASGRVPILALAIVGGVLALAGAGSGAWWSSQFDGPTMPSAEQVVSAAVGRPDPGDARTD